MIIAWMSYGVIVSLLLFAGALAAEFVCRALGWATRTVWCAAFLLAIGLSARALVLATRSVAPNASASTTIVEVTRVSDHSATLTVAPPRTTPPAWRASTASLVTSGRTALDLPERAIASLGSVDHARADRSIVAAMELMTGIALVYLLVVALRVRRVVGRLEVQSIQGHRVLVSDALGPALLGIARPRIVIPRWVLSLGERERGVILAHEQQHADAGDQAVLAGAAVLLALAPWNLVLWAMFSRLRLAIEADCDRRVLASHGDARRYGELLLTVYERSATARPQLAFVGRQSNLELRVRRLVDRAPRLASRRGVAAVAVTTVLVAVACRTEAPTRKPDTSSVAAPRGALQAASVIGVIPRCMQATGYIPNPGVEQLTALAKQRHPAAFDVSRKDETAIGFLFDENCIILRDTLMVRADGQKWNADTLLATVFRDTTSFRGKGGVAYTYVGTGPWAERRVVKIVHAVKPSAAWRMRWSQTPCGIGVRFDDSCSLGGPLVVRMMDSVRALVAIRRFGAANEPVDHLFLISLSRPNAALVSQTMAHGIVVFQSGALYVEDLLALQPLLWIGAPSSPGLPYYKRKRDVSVIDQLLGISHYMGGPLTLEQVEGLKPASRCDGPSGSCFEVGGKMIEFPM